MFLWILDCAIYTDSLALTKSLCTLILSWGIEKVSIGIGSTLVWMPRLLSLVASLRFVMLPSLFNVSPKSIGPRYCLDTRNRNLLTSLVLLPWLIVCEFDLAMALRLNIGRKVGRQAPTIASEDSR